MSPSGVPLLPDCIHFNWLQGDLVGMFNLTNTNIDQVDTHLAILDVIFNIYCHDKVDADTLPSNVCCK